LAQEILQKQAQLRPASANPVKRQTVDPRSNLLASIREGIKLRSVQNNQQKQVEKDSPPHDVASILARRVAMQLSDSDSNHSDNETDDGWDDDSQH
jgi:WAS family protein 3